MFGFAGQDCSAGVGPGWGASEWRPADGQDRPRKRAGTAHTHIHADTQHIFIISAHSRQWPAVHVHLQTCLCSISTCKWYPDLLLLCLPPLTSWPQSLISEWNQHVISTKQSQVSNTVPTRSDNPHAGWWVKSMLPRVFVSLHLISTIHTFPVYFWSG